MSDVKPEESVKPVEAKLVEPEATPAVTDTVPTAPVVVAEETPKTEEVEDKKEEKPEPKEITQGAFLQKSHGGLLSFFKLKRFFYFQEEAVSESHLKTHLKTYFHKDTSSKANCAYALQTGKGLWFYSKDEGHKHPHGIIKLSDVTEVTESGSNKFVLKLSTGDLHFEAPAAERDSWVFTLRTKIAEAKTTAEEVHESEAYKAALEKLSKHAKSAVAKEEPKETTEEAAKPVAEEAKTDAVVPETTVTSDEEEHKTDMKRSQSKKNRRIPAFSVPFLARKERVEDRKDEKNEEAAAVEEPAKPDATAPGGEAVVTEPVAETQPTEEEEAKPEETRPEPKKNRQSFFSRFGGPKREETATEKGKEVEAVKSPVPKAPVEEKIEDKVDTVAAAEPAPVVEDPKEVAPVAATEETAETKDAVATSPKEKRKSSFFGFGGREKKTEDIKSDSEDGEPVATKPSTSPVPKGFLGGLKRRVSKAGRTEKEPKEVATPAAVAEEETTKEAVPETAKPVKTETEAKPEETPAEVAPAVSDVAAAKPVQAAA